MYSFTSLAYFEEYHYNQTSPSCMQQSPTHHVIKSVLLSRPFLGLETKTETLAIRS